MGASAHPVNTQSTDPLPATNLDTPTFRYGYLKDPYQTAHKGHKANIFTSRLSTIMYCEPPLSIALTHDRSIKHTALVVIRAHNTCLPHQFRERAHTKRVLSRRLCRCFRTLLSTTSYRGHRSTHLSAMRSSPHPPNYRSRHSLLCNSDSCLPRR